MKCAICYKEINCVLLSCNLCCDSCMEKIQEETEEEKACFKISNNIIDKCKSCKKDFSLCHAKKRVCFRDVYGYEEAISPDLVLWCSDWEAK